MGYDIDPSGPLGPLGLTGKRCLAFAVWMTFAYVVAYFFSASVKEDPPLFLGLNFGGLAVFGGLGLIGLTSLFFNIVPKRY